MMKKCLLCSKFYLLLKKVFGFFGLVVNCQNINVRTYDSNSRVDEIASAAPNCECEKYMMSKYSSGVVKNTEEITIFVFNPMQQIDRQGNVKPNIFSHIHSKGRSVQRESIASDSEILEFASDFLLAKSDRAWKGVITATADNLRSISIDGSEKRALCIYDMSEKRNPAHAEIGRSYILNEEDKVELRHKLLSAFGNGKAVIPENYRQGSLLNALPLELQNR